MDTAGFDQMTRRLHTASTRRRLGGMLAGLLAVTMPNATFEADAKRSKHKKHKKRRNTCRSPRTTCGKTCVDLATDAVNCGACGNRCAAGEAWQNSTCGIIPQALGCTAEDSICLEVGGGANIHNCNDDTDLCAALNDGSPVCTSASACIACTNAADCVTHFQTTGDAGAQSALCIDACPHCFAVFGVNTVCIIPSAPVTP